MSSKRAIRRRSCKSKQRHETHSAAIAGMRSMKKASGSTTFYAAYKCVFCGGWHYGRPPGRKR